MPNPQPSNRRRRTRIATCRQGPRSARRYQPVHAESLAAETRARRPSRQIQHSPARSGPAEDSYHETLVVDSTRSPDAPSTRTTPENTHSHISLAEENKESESQN